MEIEVFRAGNAAANAAGITAADLADIAAFDCAAHPVPNVIGHPTTDSPAHGAIVKFRAEGNSLFADVPETLPAFKPIIDGVKGSTILGRSMAFFGKNHPSNPTPGKLAPKHLGFLGGAAVGIPGMPPLAQAFAFSADDVMSVTGDPAPAIVFEAAPTPVITVSEPPAAAPAAPVENNTVATEAEIAQREAAIAERERIAAEREQTFAAEQRTARETANAAQVDALVAATKVLPADRDNLVAAFNAVADADVIAFASDDKLPKATPAAIIASIMAKGGNVTPAAPAGSSADALSPSFSADGNTAVADLDKVRADRRNKYGK
jgi:hypothetical protein